MRDKILKEDSVPLGPYFSFAIRHDMKHFLFSLARYKFAVQMLKNTGESILELGCNEGFTSMLLAEKASNVVGIDFDDRAIDWARRHYASEKLSFLCEDFLGKVYGKFDAVVSLDVIEHIEQEKENLYLKTIADNLKDTGFALIGTPNITALEYMSEGSRLAHVNLYSQERMQKLFLQAFNNVFMFGMNDEVLHTGFAPMCHYIFALACGKKH
jgi:2-polyprenyl-3-methyl-5-hydroxy-6-metoxy-1,4-benzoquinol methylase